MLSFFSSCDNKCVPKPILINGVEDIQNDILVSALWIINVWKITCFFTENVYIQTDNNNCVFFVLFDEVS